MTIIKDPGVLEYIASLNVGLDNRFMIRSLEEDDFGKGFLKTLSELSSVGNNWSREEFKATFNEIANHGTFVLVIEDREAITPEEAVVACGTLMVERHAGGYAGHIEDIVTRSSHQGKSLGKRIITTLTHIAKLKGCYKVILDCHEKNVPFYEKCRFSVKGLQMYVHVPENDKTHGSHAD